MARREFSKAVKVACVKRATRDGRQYCEQCGALAKRFEIDHVDPDGLTGKPVLENAKLLCKPCHDVKTPVDVAKIARAKRREAKHIGADKPAGTIKAPPKDADVVARKAGTSEKLAQIAALSRNQLYR
jgi:5-methylcytosine-specific restriction enzyme A